MSDKQTAAKNRNKSADKGKKGQKGTKPTSLLKSNLVTNRVLSVVAFIISTAYIAGLVLDIMAEAINYDLLPLQTLVYYMAPMFLALAVAYIFNALATFQGKSWWNLLSSIMYIVTMVMFTPLWYCVILQCILTFLSFFRMRNREVKQDKAVS